MAEPLRILAWPAGDPSDLNPYVRRMYGAFRAPSASVTAFRPLMRRVPAADIFHIHWPEGIFEGSGSNNPAIVAAKAARVLNAARGIRRSGGKLVVTAHNVTPHRDLTGWRHRIWHAYHARLLGQIDHLIGLSAASLERYRAAHPAIAAVAGTIIPHPHYREDYPAIPRAEARAAWAIPDGIWVLGMIGSLRPSKNLVEAAEAFLAIRRPDEMLLIAGDAGDDDIAAQLAGVAARSDGTIRVVTGPLDDARFASAIAACDACLMNQTSTLNSGTALVTLSLDRPLLAPAVGTLPSLAAEIAGGWVTLFDPPLAPSALRASIDTLRTSPPDSRPDLEPLDPMRLSKAMLARFRDLASG